MAGYACSKCGIPGKAGDMHKGCGGWFTTEIEGLTATQLEAPPEPTGAPLIPSTQISSRVSPQVDTRPASAPEPVAVGVHVPFTASEPDLNIIRRHWANGSKPTAALCDVITMLEPLSSDQRAKVIAATSAWFNGGD